MQGGGININGGTVNIDNSQISSNTATGEGGGIAITGGDVTINNAEVSSNTADNVSCLPSLSSAPLDDCNHDC